MSAAQKLVAVGPVQRVVVAGARGTSFSSSSSHDRREANESPVTHSGGNGVVGKPSERTMLFANRGESDAKSAEAVFEKHPDLIGRRQDERDQNGAGHQPSHEMKPYHAPDESAADEISSPQSFSRAPLPSVCGATVPGANLPRSGATYLQLFRSGLDTRDIARLEGVSEAAVYNTLGDERRQERAAAIYQNIWVRA